jgi:hypothetical protein
MNNEPRVFDVSNPQATPTSRPIIVGHQPTMTDPMVNRPTPKALKRVTVQPSGKDGESHMAKPVPVTAEIEQDIARAKQPLAGLSADSLSGQTHAPSPRPEIINPHAAEIPPIPSAPPTPPVPQQTPPLPQDTSPMQGATPPETPPMPAANPSALSDTPPMPSANGTVVVSTPPQPIVDATEPHLQSLPVSHMSGGSGRLKLFIFWILTIAVLTAVGMYLLIDSGIISTNINLPYHVING